jgi:hypothetical protein
MSRRKPPSALQLAYYGRMDPTVAQVRRTWRQYQAAAVRKKLTFTLTEGDVQAMIFDPCCYCGQSPEPHAGSRVPRSGIDRVDNSKGYSKENCVPCCTACNVMKHKLTRREFIDHCRAVAHHQGGKHERPGRAISPAARCPLGHDR